MTEAEAIILLKRALQTLRDIGQDDANIVIEVRRKEPRHVRFDYEVKPPKNIDSNWKSVEFRHFLPLSWTFWANISQLILLLYLEKTWQNSGKYFSENCGIIIDAQRVWPSGVDAGNPQEVYSHTITVTRANRVGNLWCRVRKHLLRDKQVFLYCT